MADSVQLGVIGGGMMGEAIFSRLIAQGQYAPEKILVSDPVSDRRNYLTSTYGVQVTDDNRAVISSECLLLAVKPQVLSQVATQLQDVLSETTSPLIISILAGVSLTRLEAIFSTQPVIRAMPNTPATVGWGMTAIAGGARATSEHIRQAEHLFQAVGEVVTIPEKWLDAVTGLSGSGPAFIALMIEALSDGGVAAGLPRTISQKLAIQTVKGTAELLQQTGWHPGELKDRTTSPGGTTIAGIKTLEKNAVRGSFLSAVLDATRRSQELGQLD
ncbi:MAG: pyrroline-5-carboxylate reductase [Cyanobacteria bacterium P01_H01_bin.15]